MSRFVFPYGVRIREDSRIEVFPAAELFIRGKGRRKIRALFHIDSGATTSVLPAVDAQELDIDIQKGKKMVVRGIFTEEFVGYQHSVRFEFNGARIQVPVIFVEALIPRVLGREGIFSKFGILFDEPKRKVAFLERRSEEDVIDKIFE